MTTFRLICQDRDMDRPSTLSTGNPTAGVAHLVVLPTPPRRTPKTNKSVSFCISSFTHHQPRSASGEPLSASAHGSLLHHQQCKPNGHSLHNIFDLPVCGRLEVRIPPVSVSRPSIQGVVPTLVVPQAPGPRYRHRFFWTEPLLRSFSFRSFHALHVGDFGGPKPHDVLVRCTILSQVSSQKPPVCGIAGDVQKLLRCLLARSNVLTVTTQAHMQPLPHAPNLFTKAATRRSEESPGRNRPGRRPPR
ncbi:hypothetical protein LZ32DRAFT_203649 [Colletotrichum eremochloae]|nr:hypothetical protein LZ32DRAFT_203649 [Colletotrichum eremochloae]